jgi:hypothetical protein
LTADQQQFEFLVVFSKGGRYEVFILRCSGRDGA